MAEPLAVWHTEHINFGRLLDLLETQVVAFHGGKSVTPHPGYDFER